MGDSLIVHPGLGDEKKKRGGGREERVKRVKQLWPNLNGEQLLYENRRGPATA